jgi:hypothetical protein
VADSTTETLSFLAGATRRFPRSRWSATSRSPVRQGSAARCRSRRPGR